MGDAWVGLLPGARSGHPGGGAVVVAAMRARRSDGGPCRAWAMSGADVCRCHGGMSPKVRGRAMRRQALVLDFERAVRSRATQIHAAYVEDHAVRRWAADVLDREVAEAGGGLWCDRLTAEHTAGGPPSARDLAPPGARWPPRCR